MANIDPESILSRDRWLRRAARELLGEAEEAEDLAQQAWVVALNGGRGSYDLAEDGSVEVGLLRPGLYGFSLGTHDHKHTLPLGCFRLLQDELLDLGMITLESVGTLSIKLGTAGYSGAVIVACTPDDAGGSRSLKWLQSNDMSKAANVPVPQVYPGKVTWGSGRAAQGSGARE
ncbi:MAG: hypothetical protein ACI841_001787 [Planctomycetota bacterium]|jgi:hypothetical protein